MLQWELVVFTSEIKFNSLLPGRYGNNFESKISRHLLWIKFMSTSCEIALRWMPQHIDKSVLVQLMAWCHQATSHYLDQCCPRYMSPHGITRPQWVTVSQWLLALLLMSYAYCQTSNIWHTKSQNLIVSRVILQLSLPNLLKPGVKSRMKM